MLSTRDKNKPLSIGGRIGGTLFFFLFFAMGMAFEVFIGLEFSKAIRQRSWKQAPCTIIASAIEEKPQTNNPFTFKVSYEYEFNARKHTSTVYKRGYNGADEYHKADKLAKRYPQGQETTCYVNPSHTPEAVLKRDSLLFGFAILFPLIFVAVGAIGIYAMWFSRNKKGKIEPIASRSQCKGKSKHAGIVFFGIFALVGGGMLYPLTIRPIAKTIDARNWIETPCKIISARVKSHEGDDGTTYSIDIFYEYQFQGQTYKSSRYGFIGGSSSGHAGKAKVVNAYKKAKNPVCCVNPQNPSEAVLKRGFHLGLLLGLVPLPFFAIGVGGIVHSIRKKKKHRLKSTTDQWSRAATADYAPPGPVILKPRYSPLTKLLGIIAFAAFWNGIVSVFVYDVIKAFQRGRPEWGLTLFMIPFVLIGLGAIVGVIHQFLALFNPRISLKLSPAAIPLGQAAELSWTVSGRRGVIENLKITLQGREEATYRSDKKTHTVKNKFYELELISTTHMGQIAQGSVGIIIPNDTMHSFEAPNNKIIWELQVHGEIKKWPDIKQNHKIKITPQAN